MKLIADRYRVVRAVGQGGMGTVWLCHDEVLGRDVAVKQVGRLPGESVPDTARALREARTSAALSHPNVVSVFDVLETDGELWLVMEYVPSRTLAETLREDGPLPPDRAARIGAQVASGLAAAHAAGTIHRDVKPGNILVSEGDLAKVSDFGIARTMGDQQLTQTGLITGTPAYFAPELARGGDPTPAADVWALGATLYAAVEGGPPYADRRNAIALLQQIAVQDPPPPVHAGVLAQPIARMMDRDPRSRWEMADAAQSLRRIADPPPRRTREAGAREPGVPTTSAPVPAAARTSTDVPESDDAEPDDAERRGPGALAWLLVFAVLAVVAGVGWLLLSGGEEHGGLAGDDPSVPGPTQPSPTAAATDGGTGAPETPTETPETTDTADTEPTDTPAQTDTPAGEPASRGSSPSATVQEYFAALPGDVDRGWTMLSPGFQQETGRDDYEAFWGSVSSVQLGSVSPAPGSALDVEITYTFDDGDTYVEQQRVFLTRGDGGWLIDGDEVLSSRQVSG